MIKLKNCHSDFIRKCFPNQSGSVIFVDGTVLLLIENSVLSTSAVNIFLSTPEGEHKLWWENGQLCQHCHYVNRMLEDEFKSWYKEGQLRQHCHYINGALEGEYKYWYEDGQLREHCHYVNGNLEGEYKSWHENGQLKRHEHYVNGKLKRKIL